MQWDFSHPWSVMPNTFKTSGNLLTIVADDAMGVGRRPFRRVHNRGAIQRRTPDSATNAGILESPYVDPVLLLRAQVERGQSPGCSGTNWDRDGWYRGWLNLCSTSRQAQRNGMACDAYGRVGCLIPRLGRASPLPGHLSAPDCQRDIFLLRRTGCYGRCDIPDLGALPAILGCSWTRDLRCRARFVDRNLRVRRVL